MTTALKPSRGLARIGVLVPFTNVNLESDMGLLCPTGVSFHTARLGGYDVNKIPDEEQMAGLGASDLTEPLTLLAGARPDIVLYGCTSATLSHGLTFDQDLTAKIHAIMGVPTVTAAGALVRALKHMGITRVGFASPYVGEINLRAAAFLADAGIKTVRTHDIGRDLGNYGQGELTPNEVFDLACAADHADAEAIVLSCTDMRSVETIERLENNIGKPVICSNQAMMFAALQDVGIAPEGLAFGRLWNQA